MFTKTRVFENALTKLISNKNPDLDQVIFHIDLSKALVNGSEILLEFLFSPKNYQKLIDYALFDKNAENEEYKTLSRKQINKNAANILSDSNKKLKERLLTIKDSDGIPLILQNLKKFMNDDKYFQDPLYASHFEKIYENILFNNKSAFPIFYSDDFADQLIPFLVENILILSYKELLQFLFKNFIEYDYIDFVPNILATVLQYASFFSYITYCKQNINIKANTFLKLYQKNLQYLKEKQPLNNEDMKIPIPDIESEIQLRKKLKRNKALAKEKGEQFFPEMYKDQDIANFDIDDSQMRAYLFLSSIRIGFCDTSQCDILLKSVPILENRNFYEPLLYCAVFSSSESISSTEAFRILEFLYYRVHIQIQDSYFDIEAFEDSEFYQTIDKYADYFSFSNKYLTKQQIYAFSLFWDHRYQNLIDNDDPFFINIDPVLNMGEYYEYPQELTPFIALRPILLSEPIYSSKLNESYVKIFNFLNEKRQKLIGDNPKNMKQYDKLTQMKIREIDFKIYEFIQRKFHFGSKSELVNYYDAMFKMIPSFQKTTSEARSNDPPSRALLNGAVFKIYDVIRNSSFFIINDEASLLLQDIENDTSFDVVQKIIQYNYRQPVIDE